LIAQKEYCVIWNIFPEIKGSVDSWDMIVMGHLRVNTYFGESYDDPPRGDPSTCTSVMVRGKDFDGKQIETFLGYRIDKNICYKGEIFVIYAFYVGCYTKKPDDKGVHLIHLDTESGKLSFKGSFFGGEKPSFLIRKGDFMYAANEMGGNGHVSALAVKPDGEAVFLNSQKASGAGTCHVAEMNGFLYAANYSSGSIFGVDILPDGSLGKVVAEIEHEGFGPNPNRQTKPYAHSVNPVPGDNLLIAADLGADKLFFYRQCEETGALKKDETNPFVAMPAGGGPRHLAFHPTGKLFYAVMEMGVSLVCCKNVNTDWTFAAEYPLLAGSFTEKDTAADIHFIESGERVYSTVRGQNLISAFNVADDGKLQLIGSYPTFGDSPRNFCISPDERFVLIANQASGQVSACPVLSDTGEIGSMTDRIDLPGASCVINA